MVSKDNRFPVCFPVSGVTVPATFAGGGPGFLTTQQPSNLTASRRK